MKPKQICIFSVVVYFLMSVALFLDYSGMYKLGFADPSMRSLGWPPEFSLIIAAVGFYCAAWYHRHNSVYLKTSLMIATTMLLSSAIEFTACCWEIGYKPVTAAALVVFLIFMLYSLKLLVQLRGE